MDGSSRSQNGEWMIGTQGKIGAGRGIDSFRSQEPTEHSRDDETAEDARCRRKMTQGDAGRRSDETRMQGRTQGRRRVDAG